MKRSSKASLLAVSALLLGSACDGGDQTRANPVPGDTRCLEMASASARREVLDQLFPFDYAAIPPPAVADNPAEAAITAARHPATLKNQRLRRQVKFSQPPWSVTFLGVDDSRPPERNEFIGGVEPLGQYRVESWYEVDGTRRDFVAVVELQFEEYFVHGNGSWDIGGGEILSIDLGKEEQPPEGTE